LINYYLLAGGINPPLDEPVGDGNDRLSFTGERHGTAAPIGPEGQRGLVFGAVQRTCAAVAVNNAWLADQDEEHDDLAMAFLPDAFATEYHHPSSAEMTRAVLDLGAHRGPGQRRALWHSLLLAGFRFGAVNLQDPTARLPSLVCLGSGVYLDEPVQRRLVEFLESGGRLLQLGPVPQLDLEGRPCHILAEALGVSAGETVLGGTRLFPSVRSTADAPRIPETRVGWLQEVVKSSGLQGADSSIHPILTDVDGRICGVETTVGSGRAILLAAEVPAMPAFFTALVARLGIEPGLRLTTSVPGVVALTSRSPRGDRLLHLLNPTGFAAEVAITLDGQEVTGEGWSVPARSGHIVPLRLKTGCGLIEGATSELLEVQEGRLAFAPALDIRGHRVTLRPSAGKEVSSPDPAVIVRRDGELVHVSAPAAEAPLSLHIR
jgi:beta-galactosidase